MSAPAAAREEGRLHEGHDVMKVEQAGDQCTLGCNFDTKRPLRDILAIYKAVLGPVFGPTAYAGRLLRLAVMLDRSDRHCKLPDGDMRKRLGGIDSVHRIMRALPEVCEPFWKTFTADGAVHAPRAVLEALTAGLASWTVCLRRLWLGGGRAVNRILNVITYVLAAIYFLVDAVFVTVAKPISNWIANHLALRKLRAWIRSLPPYPPLALFSVPVIIP